MNRLSREQERAYQQYLFMLTHDFSILQNNGCLLRTMSELLPTDFVAGCPFPFLNTKIPKEKHWTWNQSNAKTTVRVNSTNVVTFRKLSPRRRNSVTSDESDVPYYKIWIFHSQSTDQFGNLDGNERFYMWCEKGKPQAALLGKNIILETGIFSKRRTGVKTEIGLVYPELLTAESFSFLKPFVDLDVAQELGWDM